MVFLRTGGSESYVPARSRYTRACPGPALGDSLNFKEPPVPVLEIFQNQRLAGSSSLRKIK
jgi:hypothetical protein